MFLTTCLYLLPIQIQLVREFLIIFMKPVVQGDDTSKAWHNLLLGLFGFRVPPEPLSPVFSGGKMDEVCLISTPRCQHLYPDLLSSFNISIWAVALCAHAACKNFAGLFVARLVLGMCEGSVLAGFLIITSMFYTRNEQTLRVGYWSKLLYFLRCYDTIFIG
jgi:MFS family permease